MVRRMAVVVLALTLNPALVRAQSPVLTVTVPSADVHKGPSTAAPVIGRCPARHRAARVAQPGKLGQG